MHAGSSTASTSTTATSTTPTPQPAHALQGASVDDAFILGSKDLYQQWGYTALTRHRDSARFYLHAHATT